MAITNKALIVNMKISAWTGRKLDKVATNTVQTSHLTEDGAGNYTKKLLPGAEELREINRIAGAIRVFFHEQTLPWFSDGSRILSSKNYLDFTQSFRIKKSEFDSAVAVFLDKYPVLCEQARLKLGDLFRETEYPTVAGLRNAFECEIAFMPVPDVGDFRVEILDSEKDAFLNRMQEIESNAMRECWTRLYEVVSKASARLQSPEALIRDSLIQNIADICALLPKLNVSDDPDLEAMRANVETLVSGISAYECRESKDARNEAAAKLNDITSKMSAFMGS